MADPTAIQVLLSIEGVLKELLALTKQRAATDAIRTSVGLIADDRDLDSQYGDEEVKFTPRDLVGEDVKGKRMSQCSFEALTLLASAYEAFAEKNAGQLTAAGKPKSDYDLRTARRARGWAARISAGKHVPKDDPIEPDERW